MVGFNSDYIDEILCDDNSERAIDKIVEICRTSNENDFGYITNYLLKLISETNDPCIRNMVALIFMDLRFDDAVPTLIALINNPNNKNCRGTLIYALESLNCADQIKHIIYILFEGNYECKWNLYSLIQEKIGEMSTEDRQLCFDLIHNKKEELYENLNLLNDTEEIFSNFCNNVL